VHEIAFVAGEGGEDPGEHPASGGGVVDALAQRSQQDSALGQRLDGADDPGQRAAEPVERDHDDAVAGPDVVQQRRQAGPVVSDPGHLVSEDPLAAGAGEGVAAGPATGGRC